MEEWQKKMKIELGNAKTMNEVLDVMDNYYDLDAPLGLMSKGVVITGVQKAIKIIGIKRR